MNSGRSGQGIVAFVCKILHKDNIASLLSYFRTASSSSTHNLWDEWGFTSEASVYDPKVSLAL